MSNEKTNTATNADSSPELSATHGSAPITTERKLMLLASTLCVAIFCACGITIAFMTHVICGLFVVMLVVWWIGSCIADVLKESRDDKQNNRITDAEK